MTDLTFTVRGLPIAQGTARAFVAGGKARIATDANRTNSPIGAWRAAIMSEASRAVGSSRVAIGPVRVSVMFVFPRPASHYLPANARRPTPVLRADAPKLVARKPDLDKLLRAVLDGITHVVIRDDAQVVELDAVKRYGDDQDPPGCRVRVTTVDMP